MVKLRTGHKCSIGIIITIVLGAAGGYVSDAGNQLRFSKQAMDIIGNAEDCRRDPYRCPAGKLTQGIGHTGSGITSGTATNEQIADWFATDLLDAQDCIEHYVESRTEIELPQPIFDAVGSFIFNAGCKSFVHSSMYQFLLENQYRMACLELPKWVYVTDSNGRKKIARGLVNRRAKEMNLCLTGLTE